MLVAAGRDACRPDDLPAGLGMQGEEYFLSPAQAQAILELRLHRLTGLEHEKLLKDYEDLIREIADYQDILANFSRLMQVIRDELAEVVSNYGDDRRTEIVGSQMDLTYEDLITEEDRVVTISQTGYAKTQPLDRKSVV